jgi:hypothetical protein
MSKLAIIATIAMRGRQALRRAPLLPEATLGVPDRPALAPAALGKAVTVKAMQR